MKVQLSDPRLRPLQADADYSRLTHSELVCLLRTERTIRTALEEQIYELKEKILEVDGKFFRVTSKLFGPSSEKTSKNSKERSGPKKPREKTILLPSKRYPDADIVEKHITCDSLPACNCCGEGMSDSGMTEVSEFLSVVPKKFIIIRQHRHKYRCSSCHGDIFTTPGLPRLIPGSGYSDEIAIDASLSKYCDLIPMDRYCQMAMRQGLPGLPPTSMIALTFALADIMRPIYDALKVETLHAEVLLADETPHRMLEGDERKNWYLWGFHSEVSCFYECHNTRSGDIASTLLAKSDCSVLLTDVYSGYRKAVREANEQRTKDGKTLIATAYCNAHARRGFVTTNESPEEAEFMIGQYRNIYQIEAKAKDGPPELILHHRSQMKPIFESMKARASTAIAGFSSKSGMGRAFKYFLNNYDGLTLFLDNGAVPIDNNASERLLRSPVVGRKTWYGTHSKKGAEVAAIHFSLIQSCRLLGLNPRSYYSKMVDAIHAKGPLLTPKAFSLKEAAGDSTDSN